MQEKIKSHFHWLKEIEKSSHWPQIETSSQGPHQYISLVDIRNNHFIKFSVSVFTEHLILVIASVYNIHYIVFIYIL